MLYKANRVKTVYHTKSDLHLLQLQKFSRFLPFFSEVSKAGLLLFYLPLSPVAGEVLDPTLFLCSSSVNTFGLRFLLFYHVALYKASDGPQPKKSHHLQPQHCHKKTVLDHMVRFCLSLGHQLKGFFLSLLTKLCSFMIRLNSLWFT